MLKIYQRTLTIKSLRGLFNSEKEPPLKILHMSRLTLLLTLLTILKKLVNIFQYADNQLFIQTVH